MPPKISKSLTALAGAAALVTVTMVSPPAAAQEPFLGAIDYFAFSFAPRGWTLCDGQLLPIDQHQSLYALLGTTFGGDGRTTFALPDMRGRVPVHDGGNPPGTGLTRRPLGQKGGADQVTLNVTQIPSHTHDLGGTSNTGNQVLPEGNTLADDSPDETYRSEAPNTDMHAGSIGSISGAHENMPPFLVVSCNIALVGIFPSRN